MLRHAIARAALRSLVVVSLLACGSAQAQLYWLKFTSSGTTNVDLADAWLDVSITSVLPGSGSKVIFQKDRGYGVFSSSTTMYLFGAPAAMKIYGMLGQTLGTLTLTPPATSSNTVRLPGVGSGGGAGISFSDGTVVGAMYDSSSRWSVAFIGGGFMSTTFNWFVGSSGSCSGSTYQISNSPGNYNSAMVYYYQYYWSSTAYCYQYAGMPRALYWNAVGSSN